MAKKHSSKNNNLDSLGTESLGGALNANAFSQVKVDTDIKDLANQIIKGDRKALAKGITLIESQKQEDQLLAHQLIELCLPKAVQSVRIGVSGSPGVGKSTFIEALGLQFLKDKRKLAVLAIDPSSSITGGSILGDKTRMQKLSNEENAFIRPTPAGKSLGGVARNTREAIMLCEAAGFNTIIIETVGVGQSEYVVESMTDLYLLLLLPGAGDELQGIKRGIVEMADLVIVNKADKDRLLLAKQAKVAYSQALHLFPAKESGIEVKVMLCSATEGTGIEEVKKQTEELVDQYKKSGYFNKKRLKQQVFWFEETLKNGLLDYFNTDTQIQNQKTQLIEEIKQNQKSPFQAAEFLLNQFLTKSNLAK